MKIGDAFPSGFLKCEDLKGKEVKLRIRAVVVDKIGDDMKPIVDFIGTDKKLVLNKTNFNLIMEVTGKEDSDQWIGEYITLYPSRTDFQGKRVDCIRVRGLEAAVQAAAQSEAADDDIPF